jgi:hypothetical protein
MTEGEQLTAQEQLGRRLAKERKNSPVIKAFQGRLALELTCENVHESQSDFYKLQDKIRRRRKQMKTLETYDAAFQEARTVFAPYIGDVTDPAKRGGLGFTDYLYKKYREASVDLQNIIQSKSRRK